MTVVKLGCDPELFLKVGDKFVSAAGFFPGTKQEPYALEAGAVQVDGCALEFNINAAISEDEFNKNIQTVLAQLDTMVKMVDKDMKMIFTPVADFDPEYWKKSVPEEAKILGCDPDFNIDGDVNDNPSEKLEGIPFRTAAGHVHIGYTEGRDKEDPGHFGDCLSIARHFHRSGVYAPVTAEESRRLGFYGGNGSFRPKSYGVELRGPSNMWVETEAARREMYRKTRATFKSLTGM